MAPCPETIQDLPSAHSFPKACLQHTWQQQRCQRSLAQSLPKSQSSPTACHAYFYPSLGCSPHAVGSALSVPATCRVWGNVYSHVSTASARTRVLPPLPKFLTPCILSPYPFCSPWQPLVFLSLHVTLLEFHRRQITQYVLVSGLFSRAQSFASQPRC